MLKLYYLQGACPLVPHTALHWAKAEFEPVRLERGNHRTPKYLAKNPQGSVPLLEDGDWHLAQNTAILEYIHRQYPQAKVFGSGDERSQAKARQWLALANSDLHGSFKFIFNAEKISTSDAQAVREYGINAIKGIYKQADDVLAKHDYLLGDEITIADVYFYVTERWAKQLGVDLSEFKHLTAHFTRVENNAGVQAALKDQDLL